MNNAIAFVRGRRALPFWSVVAVALGIGLGSVFRRPAFVVDYATDGNDWQHGKSAARLCHLPQAPIVQELASVSPGMKAEDIPSVITIEPKGGWELTPATGSDATPASDLEVLWWESPVQGGMLHAALYFQGGKVSDRKLVLVKQGMNACGWSAQKQ